MKNNTFCAEKYETALILAVLRKRDIKLTII